ncbi:hypothetical protein ABZV31_12895 [Streptomyces sp. NPDC005202]|uniref:hypothetical protein n=1 Tax=Streptomyces sp. NPDC005202 TaxID=3157021 RepID=UPI0033BC666F
MVSAGDTAWHDYDLHVKHGGTGIEPGRYVVRRQRERSTERTAWFGNRMIAD